MFNTSQGGFRDTFFLVPRTAKECLDVTSRGVSESHSESKYPCKYFLFWFQTESLCSSSQKLK